MGGGEWVKQKQVEQTEILDQAYQTVAPLKFVKKESQILTEIRKPDLGDEIYVWVRTFTPSWLLISFIVIGLCTVVLYKFKREIRKGLLSILKERND